MAISTRNVTRAFRASSVEDRTAGISWYSTARDIAIARMKRALWEFIGDGEGIHWPELDEDIEVDGLIAGKRSSEGEKSLQRWLTDRGLSRKS